MPKTAYKPETICVDAGSVAELNRAIVHFESKGYLLLRVEKQFGEFFCSYLAIFGSLEYAEYYWRCLI